MKKNILVITTRFPFPVIGGDVLRIYYICKYLSKYHNITLLSLTNKKISLEDIPLSFQKYFKDIHIVYKSKISSALNCILNTFGKKPLQCYYYKSIRYKNIFNQLLAHNDIVLCHLIRLADLCQNISKPVILEFTDAISLNYSRLDLKLDKFLLRKLIYKFEQKKVLNFEIAVCNMVSCKSFVSKVDVTYLSNFNKCFSNSIVTPCGVNLQKYKFSSNRFTNEIIFVGNLYSVQNLDSVIWFISNVLPLLESSFNLKVVGKISNSNKKYLNNLPRVSATGTVDCITNATQNSLFGICTVQIAAGIQNKILEYMSLGIVTFSSSIGNEGIYAEHGKNIIIEDNPLKLAQHLQHLSKNLDEVNILRENAYDFVNKNFNWNQTLKPFKSIIDSFN